MRFAWRRLLARHRARSPPRQLRLDALPPADAGHGARPTGAARPAAGAIADKIAPLALDASPTTRPPRINLLIPTIDLQHFFGGYIAKFNLARRLPTAGCACGSSRSTRSGRCPATGSGRSSPTAGSAACSIASRSRSAASPPGIEVSRADSFIATTWWTAHIAHRRLAGPRARSAFLYLIQEYEPFTFPMGTYAALAGESYGFPHYALFSTELLRDYFRAHGIGVYAAGSASGDEASAAFQNAITPVAPPTVGRARRAASRAGCCSTPARSPTPRATCSSSASWRSSRALERGRLRERLGAARDRHGRARRADRPRRRARSNLLPRSDQSAYAGPAARARRRALADVHAAPEPRPDRDGLGRDAHRHEQLREQDRRGAGGDLVEPDHRRAHRRERHRAPARGGRAGSPTCERRVRGSDVPGATDWEAAFGPTSCSTEVVSSARGSMPPRCDGGRPWLSGAGAW